MGKILITGPGRSGTTFLVQLLTRLGLDTGFEPYKEIFIPEVRAGGEWCIPLDIYNDSDEVMREKIDEAPRILKSCEWGLVLKQLIKGNTIEVDHIIIPVRDLEDAAKSRLEVGLDWMVADNLEGEDRVVNQADIKAIALGRAIEVCLLYDIPYTLMLFPRFVDDIDYCWGKLFWLGFRWSDFQTKYYELVKRGQRDKVFCELYVQ